eukprot:scaffold30330_cov44-Tisochrysis_lutea.AAC.1
MASGRTTRFVLDPHGGGHIPLAPGSREWLVCHPMPHSNARPHLAACGLRTMLAVRLVLARVSGAANTRIAHTMRH